MPTVRISYDPDLSLIGTVRSVDRAEARRLIRAGHAVEVDTPATPDTADGTDLTGLSKAQLVEVAAARGVDVDTKTTKPQILKLLA